MSLAPKSRLCIAALLVPLALVGCGSGGGGASTDGSGALTIYSGRDQEYVGPLIDRFKKQHPEIDVKVRYGSSSELAATIREEGDRSPADLFFSQDAGALGALQQSSLLGKLPASILDRVESKYRSTAGDWVGITGRVRVLGYDSRAVKPDQLPASVFDLTKPEWKGKVGWAPTNASFQSFVTAMRLEKGDAATLDWLEAMKSNDAQPYEKNSQIRDAVANGEIKVGLINHYYILEGIKEGEVKGDDYPVKIHFFPGGDVGSLVNVAGIGILRSASNQQAARLFTEYALSEKGQEYFVEATGEYPLVKGVDPDPSLPALADIQSPNVDLADLSDLEGTLALMRKAGVL